MSIDLFEAPQNPLRRKINLDLFEAQRKPPPKPDEGRKDPEHEDEK